MTSRALAAPLAALVLVLSACSGGDDAAAPAEVDPEESYVEQATEICSSADEEFVALRRGRRVLGGREGEGSGAGGGHTRHGGTGAFRFPVPPSG